MELTAVEWQAEMAERRRRDVLFDAIEARLAVLDTIEAMEHGAAFIPTHELIQLGLLENVVEG